jgi:hypothetical protein
MQRVKAVLYCPLWPPRPSQHFSTLSHKRQMIFGKNADHHEACIVGLTLEAGMLARSQYPEGPATGHLDTGFSWYPCVYKRMLRWFPRFQVATTCLSCSPPDLNFLVTNLTFVYM